MKYWESIIEEGLSFKEAMEKAHNCYVTRPCWDGVHFKLDNVHFILLKNGRVVEIEDEQTYDKDKNDWILVEITQEALNLFNITDFNEVNKFCGFCNEPSEEEGYPMGDIEGEDLILMKNGTYSIYNCWYRGGDSLLSNVKFCPYCGRKL